MPGVDDGDRPLTPDERRVLRQFAHNYLTGRRIACYSFRLVVSLGALSAALMSIGAAIHATYRGGW